MTNRSSGFRAVLGFLPVIGVSSAISRPRAPVFVSLPPFPSSWKAIKTVIPTVLNYGMIGYPFIMPGAVGGDVALSMSDNNPDNDYEVIAMKGGKKSNDGIVLSIMSITRSVYRRKSFT